MQWILALIYSLLVRHALAYNIEYREVLLIAGNFSLKGGLCNLAQYDIASGLWSSSGEPDLFLYGKSYGVVWNMNVNRSKPSDNIFVVGNFDALTLLSQTQYCSVGAWDGLTFNKIGEGICPRGGGDVTINIRTSCLTDSGDFFVGGVFESRVWNGQLFIEVYNIAYYKASIMSWLPLDHGRLTCVAPGGCITKITSLVWDSVQQVLYIGGKFNVFNRTGGSIESITSGIAVWSSSRHIEAFPGGGLGQTIEGSDGEVVSLAFDEASQSLFVAGSYSYINDMPCSSIAVWHRPTGKWMCLNQPSRGISTITTMMLHPNGMLYIAGWASPGSDWTGRNWGSPYAIAVLDIRGYIREHFVSSPTMAPTPYDRSDHHGGYQSDEATGIMTHRQMRSEVVKRWQDHRNVRKMRWTSAAPTSTPTERHSWTPDHWKWLEGFSGANGPIFAITPGEHYFSSALFIAGAFNNVPAVVMWHRNKEKGGEIVPVGGDDIIGLITSVVQVVLPVKVDAPNPAPSPIPAPAFHLGVTLVACILGGVIIGVLVAVRFFRRDSLSPPSYDDRKDESPELSLQTLAGSGNKEVDIKACYARAMRARSLSADDTMVIINPQEIILSRIIGEGSFGRVWSGVWRNNKVAVKEFVFAQAAIIGGSQHWTSIVEEIIGEAGVMTCLSHPKILQLYGCSLTMQAIWIVCELCERGSLRMVLNDKQLSMTFLLQISLCLDIADGMMYLHRRSPPIIHRDLKTHNIFVTEPSNGTLVAKIGDWGSARAVALSGQKSMTQGVGTACWLAPEVINHAHWSKATDMFAYGIVLWEIFTRQEVHTHLSAAQIIAKVANEGLRPIIPYEFPTALKDLMRQCWSQDPNDRPGFHNVISVLSELYSKEKAEMQARAHAKQRSKSERGAHSTLETSGALLANKRKEYNKMDSV